MSDTQSPHRKVLVIDDNFDAADTLCDLLKIMGHRAEFRNDGAGGLSRAKEMLPEIILLDIGMPVMNGFEVARQLRRLPELDHCVVTALTAWGDDLTRSNALSCGFDLFLTKPVNIDHLTHLLKIERNHPDTGGP